MSASCCQPAGDIAVHHHVSQLWSRERHEQKFFVSVCKSKLAEAVPRPWPWVAGPGAAGRGAAGEGGTPAITVFPFLSWGLWKETDQ